MPLQPFLHLHQKPGPSRRFRNLRRVGLFVVAINAASCACAPDPPADHNPANPPPQQPGITCEPASIDEASLLGIDEGDTCPWTLVAKRGDVELRHHRPDGHRSSGPVPQACQADCRWQLARTPAGPAVLATLPGTFGETPRGLWLGIPAEHQLVFTPLWMGVHTHVDGADIGPAWWLEPSLCPEGVVLTPAPRLPVVRGEAPPPEVVARGGTYQISGTGSEATLVANEAAPSNCHPLDFDIP